MAQGPRPEPAGTGAPDDGVGRQAGRSPDPPGDAAAEVSPSEQRATEPWVQATDASGDLSATKEMPEPDSLGG
jgi:hypothetical protein